MSESIVREAVKEHREQLCRLIDALLNERDAMKSLRSRLCAALGLPADSAPEMVAEAVEARRVVVPELTEEDLVRAGGPYCINDREPFQRGARWAAAFIRENSRAIPSDRVLGESKPLACAPQDCPILAFWECPSGLVSDVVKFHNGDYVNWAELIEYEDDEDHAFSCVPWGAEWVELPNFSALRANQGGAEHGNG